MTSPQTLGLIPAFELRHRVIRAREVAGFDQFSLAELIGVSRSTLQAVEQGRREPRRGELMAIAMATGVSFEWLETGKAPAEPEPGGGIQDDNVIELCAIRDSNPEPAD